MFSKNFVTRTISAAFILLFMLGLVFINGYFLLAGLLFLSSLAIYELDLAFRKMNFRLLSIFAYIFNALFIIVAFYSDKYLMPMLSIYLLILLIAMIFSDEIKIDSILMNSFIAIYISLSYVSFILIKEAAWLFYIFGIASITDTFAYLAGNLFGKHKLYEKLSPKKTVEGALGGILGAILFALLFKSLFTIEISYLLLFSMNLVLSVISQLGDLIASYIKRRADIKDYGYIFKGHGGVMDRFDSVLLIAPIIYMILTIIRS
ncbi:MAG: phosphatidate cytidylyltransferase [Tissierellia bacterium]|nr:phosphatidate cytidylyltransferase [Tissierellia bacterium]